MLIRRRVLRERTVLGMVGLEVGLEVGSVVQVGGVKLVGDQGGVDGVV